MKKNNTKNILFFIRNLKGRGVSKVYLNLAKAFNSYGYNTNPKKLVYIKSLL
jgi:hypothetical protein